MADTAQTVVPAFRSALFDLDGTFADTAPDLADALNCLSTALRVTIVIQTIPAGAHHA